jgi:hypothetical protein
MAMSVAAALRSEGLKTWTTPAEQETNARCGVPAKTTSRGSSLVLRDFTTFMVMRLTTLTVSERVLTTQASLLPRARTVAGSMPTGTDPIHAGEAPLPPTPPPARVKTSRVPAAVLTTRRREPSGVSSMGWTWGVSQLTKVGPMRGV